jgi:hypothetical protein
MVLLQPQRPVLIRGISRLTDYVAWMRASENVFSLSRCLAPE